MRKILITILAFSFAFPLFLILCMETEGTTHYVAGEVSGTWTSGDLYIVTDNITVPQYKTLTIEPDVTVKFYSGKYFHVDGTLYVNGEKNRRVTFTTNELSPQICAWVGLRFVDSHGWIKNTTIEYAGIGIKLERSNIEIIDTKIDGGYREGRAAPPPAVSYTGGIYCFASSPKIVNVSISDYFTVGFLGSSYGYNYGIFGDGSKPEIIGAKIWNITRGETSESHLIYAARFSNFKVVSSELLFNDLTTTRFTASGGSEITFIDVRSPIDNFSITDSNVTIKNYLDVKTVMVDNITPIEGADLQVIDGSTVIYASQGYGGNDKKTDYNGFAKKIVVTDRIYFGSLTPTENITMVNVKYSAWSESRVVNMSTSHTELFKTDIIPPAKYLRNVTKTALKEVVNEYLASPLVVNVTSESGYPILGAEVNWEIISYPQGSKNHTLNFTKTFTNSTGEANVTFRVGEKVGEYIVNASVASLTNVSFHIFGIPAKIHHIYISPPNATLLLNTTQQFNATPYDVFGNEIEIFENIKWSLDPIDLGTIDENGTFKASAEPKIGYVIASIDNVEARAQISIYTDIGSLSGVVEDSEGKKLQDVNIKLYLNGSLAFNTTTDANGYYTLTLNIGNYKVNASLAGYSPDEKEVTIIGGEGKTLNFVLMEIEIHELSTLTGKVKDSVSNTSIEGVGVSIFYSNGALAKKTLTDKNGDYSFLDLETGTYYISADKEGYNPYQAKMLVLFSGINYFNFTIQPKEGGLSLTIIDSNGNFISDAKVKVMQNSNLIWEGKSDKKGKVALNLQPGNYKVSIGKEGYIPYETNITISPGKDTSLQPTLLPTLPIEKKKVEEFPLIYLILAIIAIVCIAAGVFLGIKLGKGKKEKEDMEYVGIPGMRVEAETKPTAPPIPPPTIMEEVKEIKCIVCSGTIKEGSPIARCHWCNIPFHQSCANRLVECPKCKRVI